jgi:hypothetical protein
MLNKNCLKKNYFLLPASYLFFVGLFLLFLGCNDDSKKNITSFGGKIKNPKGEYVYLFKGMKILDSAKLDSHNKFKMKVDSIEIGLYTFKHGNEYQYLYLEPTDSLLIYLNTWDFDESLIFSGKGSAKNNFLINLYLQQEKNEKNFKYNFKLNEKEFSKLIDEGIQKQLNLYKQLIESEDEEPSEFFDTLVKTGIYFPYYSLKEQYAYRHQRALKLKEPVKLSDDFFSYRNDIDLNNEALLNYAPYSNFIITYLYNQAYAKSDDTGNSCIELNFMEIVNNEILIESFKNRLLARGIWGALTNEKLSKDEIQAIQEFFFTNCTDDYYVSELKKSIYQKDKLVYGNALPKLTVYNLNNKEVILNNIAKGSTTVIYFWPTDLGRIEMLNEKLKYFKKKYPDILFIGIERNKNKDDWKKFVEKNKLPKDTQFKLSENSETYSWFEGEMARTIIINDKGNVENGYLFFLENNLNQYLTNLKKN